MAPRSVGYSVGNVRVKENSLLGREQFERLLSCGSERELLIRLREFGYPDSAGADELLREETANLRSYVLEVAPDPSLYDVFLIPRDFSNAKSAIKGVLGARAYRHLLRDGTVSGEAVAAAVEERDFSSLPEHLAGAVSGAYTLLAETGDPQLCDGALDRAAGEAVIDSARARRLPVLTKYCETEVYYRDIKAALRAAAAGKPRVFLVDTLTRRELCPREELIAAALAGTDAVLAFLGKSGHAGAAAAFGESPASFERYVEGELLDIAGRAASVTMGEEVLLGYYFRKSAELRTLRTIAVGVRAGQSAEAIRGRVRI